MIFLLLYLQIGVANAMVYAPKNLKVFDYKSFVELIDVNIAGLEKVKDAKERNDFKAACMNYISYFRNKKIVSPLLKDWSSEVRKADCNTEEIDNILLGYMWDGYSVYKVPSAGLDWNNSPLSGLTRFGFFPELRSAIYNTQDPRYINFAVKHIMEYFAAYPIKEFIGKKTTSGWYGYDKVAKPWYWTMIGHRLGELAEMISLLRSYPEISDEEIFLILNRIYNEAKYMKDEIEYWISKNHNGGCMMVKALMQVSAVLSDMKESSQWISFCNEMTNEYLNNAFYPDGMNIELSTAYGASVVDIVQEIVYSINEEILEEDTKEKLRELIACLIGLSKPTRYLPAFGDLYAGKIDWYIFPPILDTIDLPWAKTFILGDQGDDPPFLFWPTSSSKQWSGYYTMRSEWSNSAKYLAIDCGPWGSTHQHGDRLSFVLSANGADFIIDPSGTSYASNEPDAFISKQANGFLHNTITVDNVDEFKSADIEKVTEEPLDNIWEHGEGYNLFVGKYSFEPVKQITWERRILFVDKSYWILQDVLVGKNGSTATVEQNFQFEKDISIEFKENQTISNAKNNSMLILSPIGGTLKAKLSVGDMTEQISYWPDGEKITNYPHGRGWTGRGSHKLEPAPSVCYEGKVTLPCIITLAMFPVSPEGELSDTPEIDSEIVDGKKVWILPTQNGSTLRFTSTVEECSVQKN